MLQGRLASSSLFAGVCTGGACPVGGGLQRWNWLINAVFLSDEIKEITSSGRRGVMEGCMVGFAGGRIGFFTLHRSHHADIQSTNDRQCNAGLYGENNRKISLTLQDNCWVRYAGGHRTHGTFSQTGLSCCLKSQMISRRHPSWKILNPRLSMHAT